jgi:hypothetical protein
MDSWTINCHTAHTFKTSEERRKAEVVKAEEVMARVAEAEHQEPEEAAAHR